MKTKDEIKEKNLQQLLSIAPERMMYYGVHLTHSNATLDDFPKSITKQIIAPADDKGFYIHGQNGCGKTHLAAAILHHYLTTTPQQLHFTTLNKLFREIKATFEPISEQTESQLMAWYINMPVLFIDDIGAEKMTDWALSILYAIIDERYGAMRKTIITSNMQPGELKGYCGSRVASRILGMCNVIKISGSDRRIK